MVDLLCDNPLRRLRVKRRNMHPSLEKIDSHGLSNSCACNWKSVINNRGMTQGSVSGPYLFNIFSNDLTVEDEF